MNIEDLEKFKQSFLSGNVSETHVELMCDAIEETCTNKFGKYLVGSFSIQAAVFLARFSLEICISHSLMLRLAKTFGIICSGSNVSAFVALGKALCECWSIFHEKEFDMKPISLHFLESSSDCVNNESEISLSKREELNRLVIFWLSSCGQCKYINSSLDLPFELLSIVNQMSLLSPPLSAEALVLEVEIIAAVMLPTISSDLCALFAQSIGNCLFNSANLVRSASISAETMNLFGAKLIKAIFNISRFSAFPYVADGIAAKIVEIMNALCPDMSAFHGVDVPESFGRIFFDMCVSALSICAKISPTCCPSLGFLTCRARGFKQYSLCVQLYFNCLSRIADEEYIAYLSNVSEFSEILCQHCELAAPPQKKRRKDTGLLVDCFIYFCW